jgi:WD40 repeat protein
VQVYDIDSGVEIVTLGGHKDIIQSVCYSPNARLLAAGSYQFVTLWNVPTGGLKSTYAGHTGPVQAVASLPDGSGVVSGGRDRSIRFWDHAGKQVRQLEVPAPVTALAVAEGGTALIVGGEDGAVRILDLADGHELRALKGHTAPVAGVSVLKGGRVATVSGDGTARIWTLPGEPGEEPDDPLVLTAGGKAPLALTARPDGQRVATAGADGTIRIWDAGNGREIAHLTGVGAPILALAYNPAGDRIAAGCADGVARLYDLEGGSGAPLQVLTGHLGAVNAVAFGPEGAHLATAGAEGGVKIWQPQRGLGVIAFGHTAPKGAAIQPIAGVAWEDAATVVTASADGTLKSWSFEGAWSERPPLGPHVSRVLSLDFNPDGTLLAAGGGAPARSGEVKLWEVGKGMLVRSLDALHSDTVFGVRFSPDGSQLASAGADKLVKITRISDGQEVKSFEGHTHHVLAVDWTADGKQLASGGGDSVIKLWDVAAGEQKKTLSSAGKQVTAVRWLPGKPSVAGASGDKQVRLWDVDRGDSGNVSRTFSGPGDYVFALAVSGDGTRIAAGGADGVLFVWDARNGQVLRKVEPAPAAVTGKE